MEKKTIKWQGSKYFLLGIDENGKKAYLKEPSWDCGWYWGFGYINGFTREYNVSQASDISYHAHWNSSIVGRENGKKSDYCHNPYDSKFFSKTVFNEDEGWKLAELMARFYTLKESAQLFHLGGAHVSSSDDYIKNPEWVSVINKVLIPETTKRVLDILSK